MPVRAQVRTIPPQFQEHRVLSVPELVAAGLTHSDVRALLRAGTLRSLGRGIVVRGDAELDLVDRVRAASFTAGADASACLLTAAVWHGWRDYWAPRPVDLCLPRGVTRHQRRPGVVLHSWHLDPVDTMGEHPEAVTTPPRTAYDITRLSSRLEVVATLDGALHRKLLDPTVLADVAQRVSPVRRSWLDLLDDRSESWLESAVRLVLHDAGCTRSRSSS